MKNIGIGLILWLIAWSASWAQVTVEVTQEQDQFLVGEKLSVAVRITNRSGRTLPMGAAEDWLTFSIESRDGTGKWLPKLGEAPVVGEFPLESSKVATKRVDLEPYFELLRPGRYAVIATVRIPGWDSEITSAPRPFNLIEGTKLWEQAVGVPAADTNAVPEIRKFILQQANYMKGSLRLYLRVTDNLDVKVFKVIPIGTIMSFSSPEPQVDNLSRLHLLYQNGPRTSSYLVFDPSGELITRHLYDFVGTRPRLRLDALGEITVNGGMRHLTQNDIPPSKPEELAAPPAPAPEAGPKDPKKKSDKK